MNMQESSRFMIGLREKGWSDKEIIDFLIWVESGNDQYRPTPQKSDK